MSPTTTTPPAVAPAPQEDEPINKFRLVTNILLVFTCMFIINIAQFFCIAVFYFTSPAMMRRSIGYLKGKFLQVCAVFMGDVHVTFTGDSLRREDFAILVANHQIDVDWWYLWMLAMKHNAEDRMRFCAKKELKYIPIFGWGMTLFDFMFLSRKWEIDSVMMDETFTRWMDEKEPFIFGIFPEGTTIQTRGMETSAAFALKTNRKALNHLLLPRTTGLHKAVEKLTGLDCIYDVTLVYDGYSGEIPTYEDGYNRKIDREIPTFEKILSGRTPKNINVHVVRRSPPPLEMEAFTKWLDECWDEKDRRLQQYIDKKTLVLDNE